MYRFIKNVSAAFENKKAKRLIGASTTEMRAPSSLSSVNPSPTPKKYWFSQYQSRAPINTFSASEFTSAILEENT